MTFSVGCSIQGFDGGSCPGCTLLTSTKFSFPYYGVVMAVTLAMANNQNPANNTVGFVISLNGLSYETGTVSYNLQPI